MILKKPLSCNSLWFVISSAAFFTLVLNIAFYKKVSSILGMDSFHDYLFIGSFGIVIFCTLNILFSLFLVGSLRKPIAIFLLISSAAGSYFSLFYGTYIDTDMITNVLQTSPQETKSLITIKFMVWVTIFAILPSVFIIFFVNIKKDSSLIKTLGLRSINIFMSTLLILLTYSTLGSSYTYFLRNNKSLHKLITPTNYLAGSFRYAFNLYRSSLPFITIGEDAQRLAKEQNQKKKLVIIVVGETSRAENFSLNGYSRETNPLLKQQTNLINFEQASSCATSTAKSVPCMFSNMPRKDYIPSIAARQDNLLDILAKTGVNIFWKENDEGCKGVCTRVSNININKITAKEGCPSNLCYDIRLLDNLDEYIKARTDDTVIVLHTNGSHGPTYFQRYQEAQKRFTPTCNSNEIDSCSREELVNVYDNTIVNVDYVLNSTIELLKKYDKEYSTAMLYLSDHGESLGEKGMYLHGMPYSIAPSQQTHIPMIFWLSDNFVTDQKINRGCLISKAKNEKVSHNNLFHSVLGIMDISTQEYNGKLDLFKDCQS